MTGKVLFIDDEVFRVRPWIQRLRHRWEVELVSSADEARQALDKGPSPDCVVLDLMIPADGEVPDRETAYGTRTGLWLLRRYRKTHPNTPVVVLTNVDDAGVEDEVKALHAEYLRKSKYGPSELLDKVRELTGATP